MREARKCRAHPRSTDPARVRPHTARRRRRGRHRRPWPPPRRTQDM